MTDSSGVATLTNVATSDDVGTISGDVVASFAGNTNYQAAANGTGNMVVSPAATTLTSVSGTAAGGLATLTATLTSSATNAGISGQTVSFTLDGTTVGTATTNAAGLATLSSVPTSDSVGTQTADVVASFTAVTDYQASQGTGNLTVTS